MCFVLQAHKKGVLNGKAKKREKRATNKNIALM